MTTPAADPAEVDPRAVADRVADSVAAEELRAGVGGVAMFALRHALRWAVRRGSVGAREAAAREGWSARANEARLRAQGLRHVAWTLVLADDDATDPAVRAAGVVSAALAVRRDLDEGSAGELLFGTTLVPGRERYALHRGRGGHVVVGVSDALYAVDVVDDAGNVRDRASLAASFRACLAAGAKGAGSSVLALTAASRSVACAVWPTVVRDNPEAARLLSEAIFSIFFDAGAPADIDATGRLAQGGPVTNRCFWHALQVVVFRNAKAALVGSFVAGVAADGALEIGARLDAARARDRAPPRGGPKPPPPRRLEWKLDEATAKALGGVARPPPVDAGGFLDVPGFGRRAWGGTKSHPSAEGAVVLALRLALDVAAPELDDLECMVGLAHVHRGLVTRLGSTTAEMRALLTAARTGDDLAAPVAAALAVHRARVGAAKRRQSAEVAFEYTVLVLGRLGRLSRALLGAVARAVAVLVAVRTPRPARALLPSPLIAVDSSVPRPPGISAVGRFGVLAPPRSIWVHHSLADDEVSFVLQLGPDQAALRERLRGAIPAALARVLAAANGEPEVGSQAPPANAPPPTRVAYRRLLGLLAAVQTPRSKGPGPSGA